MQDHLQSATEMLLWTDGMTETTWQPFSTFAVLLRGEEIYVRFQDELANTSPETAPFEVYLPVVVRE